MNLDGRRRRISAAVTMACAVSVGVAPSAAADPPAAAADRSCPDIEVVYARGTGDEPGVGPVGQEFTDSLRSRVGAKSLRIYPVNYPATEDWPTGVDGIRDASAHIQSVAQACPKTKVVLGGWSQGAAVAAFVTADAVPEVLPEGLDPEAVPQPMPPEVAEHVAAVVLFAKPNDRAMGFFRQPPIVIGPLYEPKTVEFCVEGDIVCSDGLDRTLHEPESYHEMVDQGAAYAAGRL